MENQKVEKQQIDILIQQLLQGNEKESAEDFVGFLRANKLEPKWGAKNSYNVKYKAKRVCIIKINEDQLDLRLGTQYDEAYNDYFSDDDEETKQYLYDSITYCFGCGTCKPGITGNILGREVENACFNPVIQMVNPQKRKLELAKRLVLLRKEAIADDRAPKTTYIAASKRK